MQDLGQRTSLEDHMRLSPGSCMSYTSQNRIAPFFWLKLYCQIPEPPLWQSRLSSVSVTVPLLFVSRCLSCQLCRSQKHQGLVTPLPPFMSWRKLALIQGTDTYFKRLCSNFAWHWEVTDDSTLRQVFSIYEKEDFNHRSSISSSELT